MPVKGSLTKTCRREGTIGSCSPSMAPTGADHGPAQMTVCEDSISPAAVRTPVTAPLDVKKASIGVSSTITAPWRLAAFANP